MKKIKPHEIPSKDQIDLARRVASVVGPSSASAQVVADYDSRLAKGEKPICVKIRDSWVVMDLS